LDVQKFNPEGDVQDFSLGGEEGTGEGQFINPNGMVIDSEGYIYISDNGRCDVQKFNPDGSYASKFGSCGEEDGQFTYISAIARDSSNNIYVIDALESDEIRSSIQKFNSNGAFVHRIGTTGVGEGMFMLPVSMALDSNDRIYILDYVRSDIQRISPTNP
jgi:DNA-binding beta-propeller fold protein YncE